MAPAPYLRVVMWLATPTAPGNIVFQTLSDALTCHAVRDVILGDEQKHDPAARVLLQCVEASSGTRVPLPPS